MKKVGIHTTKIVWKSLASRVQFIPDKGVSVKFHGNTVKERKSIYIAPFYTKVHTKRSGMDHTVLPANNTMPDFPS